MKEVYVSKFNDCLTSNIVHRNLINVINYHYPNNYFKIVVLNLYDSKDAVKADELNVFDAPCITCDGKHLQGLVTEDVIYKFLEQFIGND